MWFKACGAWPRRWRVVAMVIGLAACCRPLQAVSMLDRSGRFAIQWWTIDDGLPEAPLNGIAFAPDGALYCTSPTRISRFDGTAFSALHQKVTDPVREAIGAFANVGFDRGGRLWVQGGRGAAMLDRQDQRTGRWHWKVHVRPEGRFNSLAFTREGGPALVGPNCVMLFDGVKFNEVATVARGDRRVLWRYGDIDPATGELWLWGDTLRPGDLRRVAIPPRGGGALEVTQDPEAGGDVISLNFCPRGPLALLPDCGAVRDASRWTRLPPILPDADYRRSGKISATTDGTVWISSHNGIIACHDGVAERVTGGLPGFSLRTGALVADRHGGIWAACFGGLLAVRRTAVRVEPVADCRAVFERADGGLLVGSPAAVITLGTTATIPERPVGTLAAASVPTAVIEDAAGRVWVGTQDNFIHRIEAEGGPVTQVTKPAEPFHELRSISTLACDAAGRIWAATSNGLAMHDAVSDQFRVRGLERDDQTARPVVIGLAAEPDGSVLAAIQSRGVERIDADGSSRLLISAATMPGRRMIVFRRDSRGDLWLGGDHGLVRHREGSAPLRLSTATGLVDDAVRQIEEDVNGRLWIATRNGHLQGLRLGDVDRLGRGEVAFVRGTVLTGLDGIGDAECIGHLSREVQPGDGRLDRIVIPVSTGVIRFDPSAVAASEPMPAAPTVVRDPRRPFRFRFSTPGLRWSAPLLYQTRLEGIDTTWSPPRPSVDREYTSLPPGDHVFKVRSVVGETEADFPTASLRVSVPTPWWRRPPAIAGLGIVLVATAAAVAREITRRRSRRVIAALEWQQAMDRERARIARDIHDTLGAGLTRMAMMSDLARTGTATRANVPERLDAIYEGARSLARSVDEIVWAVNPRNDTVTRFVSYVVNDVEEFVHAGDISLRLDVPDGPADERPLPTHVRHHACLAVREALQNVLRHARATHVDFGIRIDGERMMVTVRDDGVGFDTARPPAAEQDGLQNIRHRIGEIGGSVNVASAPHAGTTVTLHVPLDFRPPDLEHSPER